MTRVGSCVLLLQNHNTSLEWAPTKTTHSGFSRIHNLCVCSSWLCWLLCQHVILLSGEKKQLRVGSTEESYHIFFCTVKQLKRGNKFIMICIEMIEFNFFCSHAKICREMPLNLKNFYFIADITEEDQNIDRLQKSAFIKSFIYLSFFKTNLNRCSLKRLLPPSPKRLLQPSLITQTLTLTHQQSPNNEFIKRKQCLLHCY